ncbi:hypothetical protein B0P06_000423 [Clostridium saccharoperbutylacetonicum]|nr:hypothetical protein [Clostridium saccharoperbutylacetonicum]NSB40652.1 hypothetical protein [Clostridium saccharoperbutylacetonicum]
MFIKFDLTSVDTITLKSGSLTVEEGDLLNLLNKNIIELVQVF